MVDTTHGTALKERMEKTCFRKTNPQITAQGEEPGRPEDRSPLEGLQDAIIGNLYRRRRRRITRRRKEDEEEEMMRMMEEEEKEEKKKKKKKKKQEKFPDITVSLIINREIY